jgi:general secretion pathway protein J
MIRIERRPCAGLTLIELLVALVILAILGLMSWRGIDGALTSRDHIVEVEHRWQGLSRGFSLIEHNLLQAAERGATTPNTQPDFKLEKLADGQQRLVYWRMDAVQGSRLTGFRLDGDKLMLLRWVHNVPLRTPSDSSAPMATGESSSAATADDGLHTESILVGVRNVQWAVLASDQQWLDAWPPAGQGTSPGLPLGVRIDMDIDNVGHIQRLFALR